MGTAARLKAPTLLSYELASPQIATLNATNVFFNLGKREDAVLGLEHPSDEYFEGICGIVAEWTIEHPVGGAGFRLFKGFRGLFGVGNVAKTRECN